MKSVIEKKIRPKYYQKSVLALGDRQLGWVFVSCWNKFPRGMHDCIEYILPESVTMCPDCRRDSSSASNSEDGYKRQSHRQQLLLWLWDSGRTNKDIQSISYQNDFFPLSSTIENIVKLYFYLWEVGFLSDKRRKVMTNTHSDGLSEGRMKPYFRVWWKQQCFFPKQMFWCLYNHVKQQGDIPTRDFIKNSKHKVQRAELMSLCCSLITSAWMLASAQTGSKHPTTRLRSRRSHRNLWPSRPRVTLRVIDSARPRHGESKRIRNALARICSCPAKAGHVID